MSGATLGTASRSCAPSRKSSILGGRSTRAASSGTCSSKIATLKDESMAIQEHAPADRGNAVPAVPIELDLSVLKQCVRCGLCLDACPTYRALGVEMDSPRGRIYQTKAVFEGKISPDDENFRTHIYQCLDCRACE